jgi:hypothetical protein
MSETTTTTRRDGWLVRMWRALVAVDEAVSSSPIEQLDKRLSALEREVRGGKRA